MAFYIINDWYKKTFRSNEITIEEFSWIIETLGEIKSSFKIGDHEIELWDNARDINEIDQFQKLRARIKLAKLENDTPQHGLTARELSTIISVATGRPVRGTRQFVFNKNGMDEITKSKRRTIEGHPNLTYPCLDDDLQEKIDTLFESITKIKTTEDLKKAQTLHRAMKLYQDSLFILKNDVDAAYLLLINSIETLAGEFCSFKPVISDHHQYQDFLQIFEKYNLPVTCINELSELLFKPHHMKLQKKFIDVITHNLSDSFFDNPPKYLTPVGAYDQNEDKVLVKEWNESISVWFSKKSDLGKYLNNIYECRSVFVHEGIEWPIDAKLSPHDVIQSIKQKSNKHPEKSESGEFIYNKPIPSYFWFERVVNDVILNVSKKNGKRF